MRKGVKEPWSVGEGAKKRGYRVCVNYPCQFSIRMTEGERRVMVREAKAAGMSLSRYVVRAVTEGRYPAPIGEKEALFSLRFQLEKAGINLNQIAKQLNAQAKGAPGTLTLSEVRGAVHVLRSLCREVERRMT